MVTAQYGKNAQQVMGDRLWWGTGDVVDGD
jgi:hypothetical protein